MPEGFNSKGTIDGNKVTLRSAGFLQFSRLRGPVASYSEGGFTLSTTDGSSGLIEDRTLVSAVKAVTPSATSWQFSCQPLADCSRCYSIDLSGDWLDHESWARQPTGGTVTRNR